MRAPTAAAYLDVSESTFLERVKGGSYPPGVRDGGVRVWLRDDLDAMIDRQFHIAAGAAANDARDNDPFAARFGKAS
jgi:predicted DNA-binding transcriptional regulator AlpA